MDHDIMANILNRFCRDAAARAERVAVRPIAAAPAADCIAALPRPAAPVLRAEPVALRRYDDDRRPSAWAINAAAQTAHMHVERVAVSPIINLPVELL